MPTMQDALPIIEISSQPIELYKVLKIANMVSGGGEAKIVISEGYVFLNGEVETQKRKKVYQDDIIEFNGEAVQIDVVEQAHKPSTNDNPINSNSPTQAENTKKTNTRGSTRKKSANNHKTKANIEKVNIQPFSAGKRKPISF